MPDNEFEKQVQQKMDEFRLEPSASVWQKVEEEIQKKKRRRIIFFIILPAVVALTALSVYYFTAQSNSSNSLAEKQSLHQEKKANDITASGNDAAVKSDQTTNTKKENIDQLSSNKETGIAGINAVKKENQNTISKAGDGREKITMVKSSAKHKTVTPGKGQNAAKHPQRIKQENELVINSESASKQKNLTTTTVTDNNTIQPDQPKSVNEAITKVVPPEEKKEIDQLKADSIQAKDVAKNEEQKENPVKKKTNHQKVKWGIDFSAGISGSSKDLLLINTQKSADALYNNSPGSVTGSPQTGQRIIIPPSSIHSGFSFKTGVSAELQVSKRSRFSTGLQYAYATNRFNTGMRRDSIILLYPASNYNTASSVNVYYGGTPRNEYVNRFHFVQVPLWYHWQMNKGKKLPLQINLGISFSYLVATNGLVYDTSYGGIYYPNKTVFNKFHFNVGTGLSLRLKGKNNSEWVIGPELTVDTRRLINNPLDKKQYLFYGGLSTRFLLPQKKK